MLVRPTRKTPPKGAFQRGSVLIEAMVAVLIFSMGVLSLVGLQSAMIKNSSDNRYRAQALLIAQTHLANMMAYGGNTSTYIGQLDKSKVSQQLPNGAIAFSSITNSECLQLHV